MGLFGSDVLSSGYGRNHRRPDHTLAGLLPLFSLLAACEAGNGNGLDVSGRPLSEGGNVPLEPTLESIQVNLFDAECTVCHSGAAAPLGLRLDAVSSFTNLVGVASRQNGSLLRVAPGNPDSSYLIRKLEGTASEGGRMPLGGPPVTAGTLAIVRQWIVDGAAPASSLSTDGPPVVVSMAPMPNTRTTAFPSNIIVGFDRDIDASTVNKFTFTLERSGADGTFAEGNEVVLTADSVSLSSSNARLAILDLANVVAVEDTLRLRIAGSGPNIVLAINGQALDGESQGEFPSGDNAEGGDFVAIFLVEGIDNGANP